MKKTFIVGQYEREVNKSTKAKGVGDLVVEVEDIAVDDWKNQKNKATGTPLATKPKTLKQWRSTCGSKFTLTHLISQQPFTLDLSPWDQVDGERYLRIDMGWIRRT